MSRASFVIAFLAFLAGCSSTPKKESQTFPAGEKVVVGPLTYNVIDTQIFTQLGDDPSSARNPQNRFYQITLAVSNSASDDLPIPGLTLVDDAGKEYPELADGTGIQKWLGVVRRVGSAQTEQGNILFDAPAAHYRLRLTDETDDKEYYADIPLNFVHEQYKNITDSPVEERPAGPVQIPSKK